MSSASERKACLLAECESWLAQEWAEQEAQQQQEEEELAHQMVELEVKEEEEQKVRQVEEWRLCGWRS